MGGQRFSHIVLLTALMVAAVAIGVFGYFSPLVRDAIYFAPERERAERAMAQLALHERLMLHKTGKFDAFTIDTANLHLKALGVIDWPSDSYLVEATLTPDKGLRLRALPRGEQVAALKVGAQMYVSQLTPLGGVRRSGWLP